jgi:hypothetical protein
MKMKKLSSTVKCGLALVASVLLGCGSGLAQQFQLAAFHPENVEIAPPARSVELQQFPSETTHKFWDNENKVLFASAAAAAAADFGVTYTNLQGGGKELNPITRLFAGSTAGLATNFAGETAGVVGLSYFFHRSGHHKLERLTPVINLGASAVAVGYGLSHR